MSILRQPEKAIALRLLNAAHLPTEDISDALLQNFWGYEADSGIVALVGLEPFARVGLLRSLAVHPAHRGAGIGTRLVRHVEAMARQMGIGELFLLTSTAQEFFEGLGYALSKRRDAPREIRSTREFAELCPASSLLMKKALG
jgi:amino-acid N-acetyltransferase